jgi:DHA3 family macrolide efflux protein-like MFS transporter
VTFVTINPVTTPAVQPINHVDPASRWQLRYWAVFLGQSSSLIGSALTQFVLLWWITDTTGSVAALSLAGFFALLPQALLGPLGGTFADRYSRRFIMIAADLVSAACMGVLILLFITDSVELWHVFTMMAIRSAMQAFQTPAAAASTAMLVPLSFLPRAAGLNQTQQGIMLVAAAPLGALALAFMPVGYALAIDVVTALLGIVPLIVFTIPQLHVPKEQRTGVWREFREGFDIVWSNRGLRRLYALVALVTLLVMPSFTLVPLLVKEHFGGAVNEVALMEGVSGAGMILGGVLAAAIAPKRKIIWVLGGFALSCFALGLVGLVPADMLWLAVLSWALSSMLYILGNAPLTALLQSTIPNQLQGRVLSLLITVSTLAAPIGLALATPVGELIGIRGLFVLMGMLGAVAAAAGLLSGPLRAVEDS